MQKDRKVVMAVIDKPNVRLGKEGINENVLNDVKTYIKNEGVVKIKVMKSFKALYSANVNLVAHEIADMVNGEVIDVRGSTFVIAKKRR